MVFDWTPLAHCLLEEYKLFTLLNTMFTFQKFSGT